MVHLNAILHSFMFDSHFAFIIIDNRGAGVFLCVVTLKSGSDKTQIMSQDACAR